MNNPPIVEEAHFIYTSLLNIADSPLYEPIRRNIQQTLGTYPRYPKIPVWKDFLHKEVRVWGVFQGYVGVFLDQQKGHKELPGLYLPSLKLT